MLTLWYLCVAECRMTLGFSTVVKEWRRWTKIMMASVALTMAPVAVSASSCLGWLLVACLLFKDRLHACYRDLRDVI